MILTNSGVLKLMQRIKSFITAQLNTKANSVHTHTISEIDDLASQLGDGYSKSEVDTLLTGKADTGHTHTKSDVTDFPSYGTTANTICEGNDSRLSDARTPTSHTHTKSEITDFPSLATVATSGSYADLSNKPTIPVIDSALSSTSTNGLQNKVIKNALDGKADSSHTHSASDITSGLATVATSGSYNDLSNKPTIPTVNNATLTIQKNGTNVQTFTANQSTNATANITVPTKTSDLTNDSGFITEDTTKIPLAGSNQISGDLIPSTDGTVNLGGLNNAYNIIYSIVFSGGGDTSKCMSLYAGNNAWGNGGALILYAENCTLDGMSGGEFVLGAVKNFTYKRLIGSPNGTLTWDGQPIQYTSDQRLKQQISEIDDKLLDAWEDVDLVQFKYNDAVDQKKDKARLHTGYVVQQIDSACKSHGVDVSAYGLYCHEEYPEETEEVEVEQADGTKVKERKVIRETSEHYSLRYTEVYAVECMYLRRENARLKQQMQQYTESLSKLEERLKALEQTSK